MHTRNLPIRRPGPATPLQGPCSTSAKCVTRASSERFTPGRNGNQRRRRDTLLDNVETSTSQPSGDDREGRVERLLRRRQERRQQRRQGGVQPTQPLTSARNQNPGVEDGWSESEWGPVEDRRGDDEENAWGWEQESWAGERQWDDDDEEEEDFQGASRSGLDPGAAWDEDIERRQRRKGTRGGYDQAPSSDEYNRSETYQPGVGEPDIAVLSPREIDSVLPVIPFSAQASFYNGSAATAVQRWAGSLAVTALLSKAALLAAGTLTWPLWWPWAQAATRNYGLRNQSKYAGLWRTQILELEARGRPRPRFAGDTDGDGENAPPPSRYSTMRTTRIVLGDPEGAQTEMVLPHDARFDLVQAGEPAELVVLSSSPNFESFKAVKDVYLPNSGIWLSEYPYLDRTEFLELSLEVEKEAVWGEEEEEEEDAPGSYDTTREYAEYDGRE